MTTDTLGDALPRMPKGEFYSCTDPDSLTLTDPWEAAEQYLDGFLNPKMTTAEVEAKIRRPLTVTAYVPRKVTDKEIRIWSEALHERLCELMGEEHLDPNEQPELCDGADTIMLKAVTGIVKLTRVWSCEESGHVDLTGEQVLAWARRENPEWFKEKP